MSSRQAIGRLETLKVERSDLQKFSPPSSASASPQIHDLKEQGKPRSICGPVEKQSPPWGKGLVSCPVRPSLRVAYKLVYSSPGRTGLQGSSRSPGRLVSHSYDTP